MAELTPKAQSLIQAGRNAHRPTHADRERIFEALREKLGDAALGGGSGAAGAAAGSSAGSGAALAASATRPVWLLVSAAVGLGIVGAGAFVALRPAGETAALRSALPALASTLQSPALPPAPEPEAQSAAVEPPPSAPRTAPAAPRRPASRLGEEVAILSRATTDLRAGRAADALKALAEHQKKFPSGALTAERRAARAEALCALGRHSEARAELARLGRKSPLAARAEQYCTARSSAAQKR